VPPIYQIDYGSVPPDFNAENAFNEIQTQVEFGPRNPNSEGHKKAFEYLKTKLNEYADKVEIQNFEYPGYDNENLFLSNIIGSFNPKAQNRIMLCAHWDTRPRADADPDPSMREVPILGANDGGSGVGILLEIAKIISTNKIDYGVDIVFFDGEDYGKEGDLLNYCLGSKYFAAASTNKTLFAILIDLAGDKNAVFPKEAYSIQFAPKIVELVWETAKIMNADKFINTIGLPIYDDHVPLNLGGINTINVIDNDYVGQNSSNRNFWHTHDDTIDKIGIETLQQVGDVLVKLIYSLSFNGN
jgi:Zn-dependent M28 family amino/carboxypeptidase